MAKAYDFPVTFTCRHENGEVEFKNAAVGQVLKLSRYHSHIIDADIKVNGKQPLSRVEIVLRIPGMVISAAHEDFNRVVALDQAVEKARIQIQRYQDRVRDHRNTAAESFGEAPTAE